MMGFSTKDISAKKRARATVLLAVAIGCVAALTACQTVPDTGPAGDAFYVAPSPLPGTNSGDVIWYHYANTTRLGVDAYQVLYRSQSATGQPIAVSGSVIIPSAKWTGSGPRPVVSVAPGTEGLGDSCAPSKHLADIGSLLQVNGFLDKGYVVAMTDYQGLGTPGQHTYIVGQAMGHAVLDMARAAQRLSFSGVTANNPVAIYGYSEGGAAAAWAGELQKSYAPELKLKGIAAGGVPADLMAVAANLDGGLGFGFELAAAVGFDAAYPELNLASYLNATGASQLATLESLCTTDLVANYTFKHVADYTTSNPLQQANWKARLASSKLGNTAQPVPIFIFRGDADEFMPLAQDQALVAAYCAKGVKVKWAEYVGDHVSTAASADGDVNSFINDRFAGLPAPTTC